ncbi:MAG: hypothetical protein JSS02_11610, partial [Planctomycetes bacterium]|nr:hypothetical protein [Planctomycetota bacterium]
EAVCRLWKVRETQLQYIRHKFVEGLQEGRKSRGQWEFQYVQDPRRGLTPLMRPYRPYPDDIPRSLRQFLLPERIEGVPLAVVASILVAYLLCVAPGDYFLLGRLHCRKYTWALFVVISAAFTGSTVLVARNYMGQADYHTSLVIADVVANSSSASEPMIARTTRFDLLFVAQPEMVEIPLRNELYTDLTNLTVQSDKSDTDPNAFWAGSDESEMDAMEVKVTDLPVYSGVIPYAYSVHQQMRQWSPRVNRRTTLGDDRDLLAAVKIPWSNLDAKSWTTEPGRQALLATLEKAVPEATVCLFNRNDLVAIHDPETQTSLPSLMSNSLPTARLATLLSSISNRAPLGFFHVVSQVAPTGGVYLEDLSVLDSSNSRQWLLVVGVKRDNEWLVYRRRYALPD